MVGISLERKGLQVTWEPGDYDGEVQLFFSREGSPPSNTDPRANDGDALVSVPYDFSGTTHMQVRTLDGAVLDEGDLNIS